MCVSLGVCITGLYIGVCVCGVSLGVWPFFIDSFS